MKITGNTVTMSLTELALLKASTERDATENRKPRVRKTYPTVRIHLPQNLTERLVVCRGIKSQKTFTISDCGKTTKVVVYPDCGNRIRIQASQGLPASITTPILVLISRLSS